MSTQVLPNFIGLGFDVVRTPIWSTAVQTNISGKETRIALQSSPRYQWELKYNFLRQGTFQAGALTEFSQFLGFINTMQGSWDSFLFNDVDDNTAVNQAIGIGDGATAAFQLVRTFGNYVENILAPNAVTSVLLNGVVQATNSYSFTQWGSTTPGILTFVNPPAKNAVITANFTFYWPVRFLDDSMPFNKSMSTVWGMKSAKFISIK